METIVLYSGPNLLKSYANIVLTLLFKIKRSEFYYIH